MKKLLLINYLFIVSYRCLTCVIATRSCRSRRGMPVPQWQHRRQPWEVMCRWKPQCYSCIIVPCSIILGPVLHQPCGHFIVRWYVHAWCINNKTNRNIIEKKNILRLFVHYQALLYAFLDHISLKPGIHYTCLETFL